jgi:Fur family ferric uptake transcriptional regulator
MKTSMENKQFGKMLRKSGYKATGPRLTILSILKKSSNPLSAQGIINTVGKDIDQATVYRTLKSLRTKGIIYQIDLRHNHAHYELTDTVEHHHLICVRCGRIEDVHHCGVEEIQEKVLRISKHFSEIKQHTLEFYGVCKNCIKKDAAINMPIHKNAPL